MINQIGRVRRNESGFTLIELLIVIVILGVLAGITVFAVSAFRGQGISTACQADAKNVEIASEAYYAKFGTYAADIPALVSAGILKEAPPIGNYHVTYALAAPSTPPSAPGAPVIGCTIP